MLIHRKEGDEGGGGGGGGVWAEARGRATVAIICLDP